MPVHAHPLLRLDWPTVIVRAIWLVSVVAALLGAAMIAYIVVQNRRPVTVTFDTAEGLVAGTTKVRYRNVDIGVLTGIRLSADRRHALADLRFNSAAGRSATCDSKFWVVRPRINTAGVSGLTTVISGTYIEADLGTSGKRCSRFTGLETPPFVILDRKGKTFRLHGDSLGSLNTGSPVFYRRIEVGEVLDYALAKNGAEVDVDVFINAPYDRYINRRTRWWHASGIDLQFGSGGLKVGTQSLDSVLQGGIVFDTFEPEVSGHTISDGSLFPLWASLDDAMRRPDDGTSATLQMRFNQSVRGLSVGAPVDFRGIDIGYVTAIDADLDPSHNRFAIVVTVNLYTHRLGLQYRQALGHGTGPEGLALLRKMIAEGLRGQLRMGSVLTGQRYVALDFFPHASPSTIDTSHLPVELPTEPGTVDELQDQLASIVKKLDGVPFDQIGTNLNATLRDADILFQHLNTEVAPEVRPTLSAAEQAFKAANAILQQDSPMQSDVHQALTALRRTLASLNALSDYVERHPESLVRGKPSDK